MKRDDLLHLAELRSRAARIAARIAQIEAALGHQDAARAAREDERRHAQRARRALELADPPKTRPPSSTSSKPSKP